MNKMKLHTALLLSLVIFNTSGAEMILGVNGHPLSKPAYTDTLIDFQLDLLYELGVNYYRIDVNLDESGKLSGDAQALFNSLIESCENRSVNIYPVLSLPDLENLTNVNIAWQYGYSVGLQFASDYGGDLDYYCLGNNVDEILNPANSGINATDYDPTNSSLILAYIHGMANAIRQQDPTSKIAIRGSWIKFGYLDLATTFTYNNTEIDFQIIDWSWYSNMGDLTNIHGGHGNLFDYLDDYGKSVWLGEVGRTHGTGNNASSAYSFNEDPDNDTAMSQWLQRYFQQAVDSSVVEAVFVYELLDQPYEVSEAQDYGLIDWLGNGVYNFNAYALKPAFDAVKQAVERARYGNEDRIRAIYNRLLNTEPSQGDLGYWLDEIRVNGYSITVSNLLTEKQNVMFVQRAYQLILDRNEPPSANDSGVVFWTNQLKSGMTRENLIVNFCTSDEFWAASGSSRRGHIEYLFRKLLRRQGSVNEVEAIEGLSLSRQNTVRQFLSNNQSDARTMDEEYAAWMIKDVFRRVFGREIPLVQLDKMVDDIMMGTYDQRAILERFLNSEAFFEIAIQNYQHNSPN